MSNQKAHMDAWRLKNAEHVERYRKEYYAANRERLLSDCRNCSTERKKILAERAKQWYHANKHRTDKAKRSEYFKKWAIEHQDELQAYNKQYKESHRQEYRDYNKVYANKNRAKLRAKNKQWRDNGGNEYMRRWAQENPDIINELANRRRARKANASVNATAKIFYAFIRKQKHIPCYYCGIKVPGKKAHIDHVIALAKSGNHSSENLCASCRTCNLKKHAKLPSQLDFLKQPVFDF